jgi:phage terminase small subunit
VNREKTGGRKLEPEKPLDPKKAQANLEAALKDPAIRARLDNARAEIKDENVLLAYEAAVFDEEGYYDARELKIQQLLQQLN